VCLEPSLQAGGWWAKIKMDITVTTPFEVFKTEIRRKFAVSDYSLEIMWRHLPYKKRRPFIKQAEGKRNNDGINNHNRG
jgi:hypothetical protein